MKKKELTEYEIVREQFLAFQQLYNDIEIVNIVNNYNEKNLEIGENTEHINYRNYREQTDKILSEEGYTILLIDDSFLTLYYLFDREGNICKHVLSFVPSYQNDLYREDMDKKVVYQNHQEQDANVLEEVFCRRISNYIRVDYDTLGQKKYYHTPVHLHAGVFEYSFRLPVQNALFPNDFLFLIFKYIYHIEDERLGLLNNAYTRRCKLLEDEMSRFRIVYGS